MSAWRSAQQRLRTLLRFLARLLGRIALGLALLWGALALWFMPAPWAWLRAAFAIAFLAFGVWALWIRRSRKALVGLAAAFIAVVIAWGFIHPTHEREWRADVAVMPRAIIDGDRVRFTGVRDFEYRSVEDFTPRYIEREVQFSKLTGVDFYISYWMPGPIGHTFLSFVFEDAEPLSISIEARPESHEGYAPIASLFKQFELIYVVGEERDLVGVRTNHRDEDVFLYRIATTPEGAQRLFRTYLERINELADRAEFYHLLSNNCTINIVRYARTASGARRSFDFRHYLNGLIDSYLYQTQRLDNSLPFEELRARAHINAAARASADPDDFPQRIRAHLSGE